MLARSKGVGSRATVFRETGAQGVILVGSEGVSMRCGPWAKVGT
jgi:hypothetical protein